jgi:hypothetical protein
MIRKKPDRRKGFAPTVIMTVTIKIVSSDISNGYIRR